MAGEGEVVADREPAAVSGSLLPGTVCTPRGRFAA